MAPHELGTPRVSVIVASYNHGRYLDACLRSVFAQTLRDFELWVIDDGSTDDSVARLEALRREHPFDLRVQPNRGLVATLTEAVARARGTYVVPFGSDDVMRPDRLATQVEYLDRHPEVGLCAGNVELIDADGQPLPARRQHTDLPHRRLDFADRFLDRQRHPPAPTFMVRRALWPALDPTIRLEDLQLVLALTHAGHSVDCLGQVLAQYRVHGANTSKDDRFMIDCVLRSYARYADHPLYPEARRRYLQKMIARNRRRDPALARELLAQLEPADQGRPSLRARLSSWWAARR
jgi:alpha-1,3-rhamnosyltransferase